MKKLKQRLLYDHDIQIRPLAESGANLGVGTQLQAGNDCGNKACCDAHGGTWHGVGSGGCEDHGTGDWD